MPGLRSTLRSQQSTTSPDYDHLLDKVIARDVTLGCMSYYGLLDRPTAPSGSASNHIATPIFDRPMASKRKGGTLPTDVQPKVEKVPYLMRLLDEGYRLVECTESGYASFSFFKLSFDVDDLNCLK